MKPMLERDRYKWVVVPAVVLILAALVLLTLTWYAIRVPGTAERDAMVAKLDATDPTWRTVALTEARNATLPPDDQNAAVQAMLAHSQIPQSFCKLLQSENWLGLFHLKTGHLPHPEDVEAAKNVLADSQDAIEASRRIGSLPSGGLPLTFFEPDPNLTSLSGIEQIRQVAAILAVDALIRASEQHGDDAAVSVHAILAVGRGLGDAPACLPQMVRMAVSLIGVRQTERILGLCEVSDNRLTALQNAFLCEAAVPHLKYAIRGERASGFRFLENIDNGVLTTSGTANPSAGSLLLNAPKRATVPDQQAHWLRLMNRILAATELPFGPTRDAEMAATEEELRCLPRYRSAQLAQCFPAVTNMNASDTRTNAQLNCAGVAMACERYRLKYKKYPETLADLSRDLLLNIPADAYSGQLLRYRKTNEGCVVYAVGPDRTDDGGRPLDRARKNG